MYCAISMESNCKKSGPVLSSTTLCSPALSGTVSDAGSLCGESAICAAILPSTITSSCAPALSETRRTLTVIVVSVGGVMMYFCGWVSCVPYVTPYKYDDVLLTGGTTPSGVMRKVTSGALGPP